MDQKLIQYTHMTTCMLLRHMHILTGEDGEPSNTPFSLVAYAFANWAWFSAYIMLTSSYICNGYRCSSIDLTD